MTRVLIVEDSHTQALELRLLLESEGFEVDTARDGRRGLEQAQKVSYDVVLSDVVMPDVDGYEMCRRLKADERTREVPVILVTSLSSPMDIVQGLECGADNFITKPYDGAYLVQRLRQLLETRELRAGRKMTMGVELLLMGKRFTINSGREQMLDLLISTFEEVLRSRQREYEAKLAEEAALQTKRYLSILLEVSELLGAILDRDTAVRELSALLVRRLADGCVIRTFSGDDGPDTSSAFSVDAKTDAASSRLTQVSFSQPLHEQAQAGEVLLENDVTDQELALFAQDEAHLEGLRSLSIESSLMVPLQGRERPLGVIWLFTAGHRSRFDVRDLNVAKDLARRAALALDNARLYREAQDAIQVRDDFMCIASHELKTPLTALMLNIQGLQRARTRDDGTVSQRMAGQLTALDRQTKRIGKLLSDLLDVSRISSGALSVERRDVDFAELLEESLGTFSEAAARAQCPLDVTSPATLHGDWDPLRLEQVIQNLLSNAIKFGAGAPVEVQLTEHEDYAELRVSDHGIGIDPEHQRRIFERFERAVSTRNYGGFGLGLWISRQVVESMGGSIHVVSEPGKGATFTVTLPRRTLAAAE